MSDLRDAPLRPAAAAAPAGRAGYRVEVLRGARFAREGVLHCADGVERRLAWDEVRYAVAAEVGEPEGVRAIVFDLVVGADERGLRALRVDAEPGPFAEEVARAIHAGMPRSRCG